MAQMFAFLVTLPRFIKIALIAAVDAVLVCLAFYLAIALYAGMLWPGVTMSASVGFLVFVLAFGFLSALAFGIYAIRLSQYNLRCQSRIALWATVLTAAGVAANLEFGLGAPVTIPFSFGTLLLPFCIGVRFLLLGALNGLRDRGKRRLPVAIYGAGEAGMQMFAALNSSEEWRPVLIIDDNPAMQKLVIGGMRVHGFERLVKQAEAGLIEQVFVAIPGLSFDKRKALAERMGTLNLPIKVMPSYADMISAGGVLPSMKAINIDDLLGRDRVELDMPEIPATYKGRSVLVTGAGGSIGSELSRQIAMAGARKLVLYEHAEYALYEVERQLRPLALAHGVELVSVLGSVTDPVRARAVLRSEEVDIVLHAAAYKHVPLIEHNEIAGVRNNVIGTHVMAEAAKANGVRRFLLVSTDKAVRPTNIMGATKRLAEMVIQDLQTRSETTIFAMVRFGNVLDSSGSVIPLFRDQIQSGGPVTLTHTEVTRYFMTIPEAARLVLLAGSFAEGGEVFVLDMGEPVRIYDLARRMIELSGLTVRDENNPTGDIAVELTGLRPGEKLYEELLFDATMLGTPHPSILRAVESKLSEIEMARLIRELSAVIELNDPQRVRDIVQTWVDGYHTQDAEAL